MVEQQKTMSDYARLSLEEATQSIVRLIVVANNFGIKPNVIQTVQQLIQFDGFQDENHNAHITNFLEVCDTFKINRTIDEVI